MPSPETEEWRYTDLRDLDLSFDAHVPEPAASSIDEVDPELLEAANGRFERYAFAEDSHD